MKNYIKEKLEYSKKHSVLVRVFYFKVKNSKLNDEKLLEKQLKMAILRIFKNYNAFSKFITIEKGNCADDFINDTFTLKIKVNCCK